MSISQGLLILSLTVAVCCSHAVKKPAKTPATLAKIKVEIVANSPRSVQP